MSFLKKNLKLMAVFSVLALLVLGYFTLGGIKQKRKPVFAKVGDSVIWVEVAKTSKQQAKGLSELDYMPEDSGMLFVFADYQKRSFWMKAMRFPIDIVWIRDDRVVGVHKNTPVPTNPYDLENLKHYISPQPVNYVLELNAGVSAKLGIKGGDKVVLDW